MWRRQHGLGIVLYDLMMMKHPEVRHCKQKINGALTKAACMSCAGSVWGHAGGMQ